jgi:peptidoglycan/LPS O-acetylase OafA/YrhL
MHHKFTSLDGLRGLAALFVLVRHTGEYWSFFPHRSYLAVDLFFLLSGFVIAHSYEARLAAGRLTALQFVGTRLVRLYPMYLLALALALLASPEPTSVSALAGAMLMLPSLDSEWLFPPNIVFWSLFFELAVNLLYAVLRPRLTHRVLTGSLVVLAGGLAALSALTGQMDLGWRGELTHLFGGLLRAALGILFGIALYRWREPLWARMPRRLGPVAAIIAVCLLFWSPSAGRWNPVVDVLALLTLLPLCVLAAARSVPAWGAGVMALLGAASYPLYLLHVPLARLGLGWFPELIERHETLSGLVLAATALLLSLWVDRFVDRPVRSRLTQWLQLPGRSAASPSAAAAAAPRA